MTNQRWFENDDLVVNFIIGMLSSGYIFTAEFVISMSCAIILSLMHEQGKTVMEAYLWDTTFAEVSEKVLLWLDTAKAMTEKPDLPKELLN
jgi:hypothetical protein